MLLSYGPRLCVPILVSDNSFAREDVIYTQNEVTNRGAHMIDPTDGAIQTKIGLYERSVTLWRQSRKQAGFC